MTNIELCIRSSNLEQDFKAALSSLMLSQYAKLSNKRAASKRSFILMNKVLAKKRY